MIIKFDSNNIVMNNYQIKNHNKTYTFALFFITSTLIFTSLIVSNGVLAQPSSSNKLSKVDRCASGDLPLSACKKVSDQSQTKSGGGVGTGQTGGGAGTNMDGSNTANSAINQNQEAIQSCATGNIKVLPHSSFTCTNTANQDQANNGSIETDQTADVGITNP